MARISLCLDRVKALHPHPMMLQIFPGGTCHSNREKWMNWRAWRGCGARATGSAVFLWRGTRLLCGLHMAGPEDLGRSECAAWDSPGPESIPSRAFTFVVFLWLFLSVSAIAFLCAAHRVSELERTLESPTEIP